MSSSRTLSNVESNRVLRSAQARIGQVDLPDTKAVANAHETYTTRSELTLSPITHGKRKREHDTQPNRRTDEQHLNSPRRTAKGPSKASGSQDELMGSKKTPTKPASRLAASHVTNAPVITPKGSRVVALPLSNQISPLPQNLGTEPITTTANILYQACNHLIQMDPKMKPLIDAYSCDIFSPEGLAEGCEPFKTLASGIIGQQVSGAAASSIKRKFIGLFQPSEGEIADGYFPSPDQVARCDVPFLRQAGLSERKAEYIKGLAEKFTTGELSANLLLQASNEDVMDRLTQVRGLGRWSAEMFAFFGLKRMDIFSTGDLGVQRGMAAFAGRDVGKLKKAKAGGKWKYMSEKDMIENSQKFAPYRSVFMFYMWKLSDINISVLEKD